MRNFLLKLIALLLFLGIIFIILEYLVFQKNSNPFSYKYNLFQEENVEVVVAGNSHLLFGVKADSLSFKTINIANKGRELETDVDILMKYLDHIESLKAVIIPVSFYSLFTELNNFSKDHIKQKRLYYRFYKLENYNQGIYKNSLLINEPYKELIDNSFLNPFTKKSYFSKLGWRANNVSFEADSQIKSKINNLEQSIHHKKVISKNINRLQDLIDFCSDKEIQLFVVLPPYSEYFYSLTKSKYTGIIKGILKDNFKDLTIIESNMFMPTDLDFYENSDHLNAKGATLYTKKIDSILRKNIK
ncbi:hypothetical protein H0I29_13600 [Polaribacter sp. R2A056_3_33]|jgi:hypothetical protein|uniref:hypothetical protein n=1 Tax=Polaribacter sp. R2A056_3_33 TaxID=2745563 RepID=UPI001C4E4A93|nr:hypothetical protein [Polaribacter sp. R2A056_3_33]QXP69643.1 hypothetical protein H0I29_13600 [Polaribacter sp. R2A056_3_33]